jgi:hypothetical protein
METMKRNRVSIPSDIKAKMKEIHTTVKETTSKVQNSQWAHHLTDAPLFEPNNHFKKASAGSVPTTPLHAALGPASAAAVPNLNRAQSKLNVFERADRSVPGPFQNNSFRRLG